MTRRRLIEAWYLSSIAAGVAAAALVPAVGLVALLVLGLVGAAAQVLT